jgi:hypothetical protein
MPKPTEQEIMDRAFDIWERNGRPEGREDEFWHLAEQEMRTVDESNPLQMPEPLT